MTERVVVFGLSDGEHAILDQLVAQWESSRAANLTRAAFYDGKRGARQVTSVVPPQYYRLGITLGWCATAVDLLARRCKVERFVWPKLRGGDRRGPDLGSVGGVELWDQNNLASELSQAMTSSLIYGPSFIVTTSGADGEPDALITVKDALSATGLWEPRSRRLTAGLSIHELVRDRPSSFTLYLDGLTIQVESDGARLVVADRHEHRFGLPMEPLVHKPMPGRPWGYSRLSKPLMALHSQALRSLIRMEGHADIYSYPELMLLGASADVFKDAAGNQVPDWRVMLGRIKAIPDDDEAANPRAQVQQFAAQSPEPHIRMIEQLAMLFAAESHLPVTSLGVQASSGNPTSADSYMASREDLIAEAEGATDEWAPAIGRAFRRALQVKNRLDEQPASWSSIAPKFRSPVYVSRASAADAGAKVLSVAPWLADTEVGLELLGLTGDQITRALAERPAVAVDAGPAVGVSPAL